jgi:hypothetical protein
VLGRKLLIQINLNYPQCLNTIWFRLNNDFRCLEEDSSFCSLSPTSTGGSSGASSSSYYYFGERQVTQQAKLFILKKYLIKNVKNQTTEMRCFETRTSNSTIGWVVSCLQKLAIAKYYIFSIKRVFLAFDNKKSYKIVLVGSKKLSSGDWFKN